MITSRMSLCNAIEYFAHMLLIRLWLGIRDYNITDYKAELDNVVRGVPGGPKYLMHFQKNNA